MALTQDSKEARMTALTRLALATREKLDKETYVLYVEDTQGFSTSVLVEACRRLETHTSWFPKLADLIEECRIVARQHIERQASKRLTGPRMEPERLKALLAEVKAAAAKKALP